MKRLLGAVDGNDVLVLVGLGMLGYGLYMVSLALALGVVGGLLLAIGLVGAVRKGSE